MNKTHTIKLYTCFSITILLTILSYTQLSIIQHTQQVELDNRKKLLDQRQTILNDLEQRLAKLESK